MYDIIPYVESKRKIGNIINGLAIRTGVISKTKSMYVDGRSRWGPCTVRKDIKHIDLDSAISYLEHKEHPGNKKILAILLDLKKEKHEFIQDKPRTK